MTFPFDKFWKYMRHSEPCDDLKAHLMAHKMVDSGDWVDYNAAYEVAREKVEEEKYWSVE
tara:strand:- start:60 stop:239 length:180 start_codon:yes stop_codon:yes gene_type:complete